MPGNKAAETPSQLAQDGALSAELDFSPLDNPIWNALRTEHAHFAVGEGLARRYPAEIGPLSGFAQPEQAGYDALRSLAGPGGVVALFLEEKPALPAGWTMTRDGLMNQMICVDPERCISTGRAVKSEIVRLTAEDNAEMVTLAKLTEPGPFERRTRELGTFFGIREAGRLVAMAGQRMSWPKFVEVSAVCTHPEERGRGYSSALIGAVVEEILKSEKTPMLHVFTANTPAVRVYEKLGFVVRRHLELAVIRNDV
jgi:GNAT superfamily N-acetyltransferase